MKRIVLILVCALALDAHAVWQTMPLEARVKNADLIVIGTLESVKPNGLAITFNDDRSGFSHEGLVYHYDTGTIKVSSVLKGEFSGESVPFASYNHATSAGEDSGEVGVVISTMESLVFQEGDGGVWFLQGGVFVPGRFTVTHPWGLMPYDSIEVVTREVDKQEH